MAGGAFQTNKVALGTLLRACHEGSLQLPDFQRSWVWDEDRIKSLIASISRAFPVGALMTLETSGAVNFKPRPVEGAPDAARMVKPDELLLDGQQRMTSLYQVTLRNQVVETVTPKNKRVKRWFYIDIMAALDETAEREEAIVGVPEDRIIRENFAKDVVLDLSTRQREFDSLMYPVSMIFDWATWQMEFVTYATKMNVLSEKWPIISRFHEEIIKHFTDYGVPVIALDKHTSKEAVCLVFEKVNTGGKPLDAFELVTAMYAADGHELRKDWYGDATTKGRHHRLAEKMRLPGQETGILVNVANTDFLQAISLFHTRDKRREAEAAGKQGKDLPAVTGNRQALLSLPLEAYKCYETKVEGGFERAAKFLTMLHIYRVFDLPYQSQIVPLAVILADIGDAWEHQSNRAKLVQWYWNGVFGELYGSAVDSRISRDFMEVPAWLAGGPEPSTVRETIFRADRLKTMRMRLSAAYKGVNALLMKEGAQDFRSGQKFDHTIFFGENVDIHHIFPQDWCRKAGIKPDVYDSIINKTPLSYKTNRVIGGAAPSAYLGRLEAGGTDSPTIEPAIMDYHLTTHLIDPALLRADRFEAFMADRQRRLLALIERAMGKAAYSGDMAEEGVDDEQDEDGVEAEMTIAEKPAGTHGRAPDEIRIAELPAGQLGGLIGVTFAPGKKQTGGMSGDHDRDLATDLDAIAAWNAAAVVTLTTQEELERYGIPSIGDEVRARFMEWHHLPIRDYHTPEAAFEAEWTERSARLRSIIASGNRILVHCRGGLGRAGMVAARLLVEMGTAPDDAISIVRRERDTRAIETPAQEEWVRAGALKRTAPSRDDDDLRDRAMGALLGLAVGDAVGTTIEFKPKPNRAILADMVGGGPFNLSAGQWTDDTAMALALADSLVAAPTLDPTDLMQRFVCWHREGTYSCTGQCFDIGSTTATALHRFERSGDPFAGSTDPNTAGNGSIMRLAPVAIRHWRDRDTLLRVAKDQSRTTHAAPEALESCEILAELLAAAIEGESIADLTRSNTAARVQGFRPGMRRAEIRGTGYVVASLHAALWAVSRTSSFRDAVLLAANLGEDADTTAAVAGQIAGAVYGARAIPDEWLAKLAWRQRIESLAATLADASAIRATS